MDNLSSLQQLLTQAIFFVCLGIFVDVMVVIYQLLRLFTRADGNRLVGMDLIEIRWARHKDILPILKQAGSLGIAVILVHGQHGVYEKEL